MHVSGLLSTLLAVGVAHAVHAARGVSPLANDLPPILAEPAPVVAGSPAALARASTHEFVAPGQSTRHARLLASNEARQPAPLPESRGLDHSSGIRRRPSDVPRAGPGMLTPKGKLDLALQRHPGLKIGNIFGLNNRIALAMYREQERLDSLSALAGEAADARRAGDRAGANLIDDERTRLLYRPSEIGGAEYAAGQ